MFDANKGLVRRAWAAYDSGDEEGFAACLAPGWKEYDGSGMVTTLDDVCAVMRLHRDAFPDKQTQIELEVAEGVSDHSSGRRSAVTSPARRCSVS